MMLHIVGPGEDPTLAWGTDVDTTELDRFMEQASHHFNVPLSIPSLLMKAVGQSLAEHPNLVRRVVGRRVYAFKQINGLLAYHNQRLDEPGLMYLRDIDQASLPELAQRTLKEALDAARGKDRMARHRRNLGRLGPLAGPAVRWAWNVGNRFHIPDNLGRLARLQSAAVWVNYLGFAGAPPMRSFKAAVMRSNSVCIHIAMGRSETRPVVDEGEVVVRQITPLIVRIDHRIAEAVELGKFVRTLADYLSDPWQLGCLDQSEAQTEPARGPGSQAGERSPDHRDLSRPQVDQHAKGTGRESRWA